MEPPLDTSLCVMETYADILNEIREKKSLSMSEVARRTAISFTFIRSLTRDEDLPSTKTQKKIEEALLLDTKTCRRMREALVRQKADEFTEAQIEELQTQLREAQADYSPELVQPPIPRVPVFEISAGASLAYDDGGYPVGVADDWLSVPGLTDAQAFGCFVHGDSMEPELNDGDIVVFSPAKALKSGAICFVRTQDDTATVKRLFFEGESIRQAKEIRLVPTNRKYPDERIPMRSVMHIWPMYVKVQYPRNDE